MRTETDAIISYINMVTSSTPIYLVLTSKEDVEEYNKANKTSNKIGDTVISYVTKEYKVKK